jgi:hypothetical protein
MSYKLNGMETVRKCRVPASIYSGSLQPICGDYTIGDGPVAGQTSQEYERLPTGHDVPGRPVSCMVQYH